MYHRRSEPGSQRQRGGAAAEPSLTLEPSRGACTVHNPPILVRGANFPPGQALGFSVDEVGRGQGFLERGAIVAPDGTVAFQLRLAGCGPGTREGTLFRIAALRDTGQGVGRGLDPSTPLASVTFTVSVGGPVVPGLPNTGAGGGRSIPLLPGIGLGLLLAALLGGAHLLHRPT